MFVYFYNPSNKYLHNPTAFRAYTQLTSHLNLIFLGPCIVIYSYSTTNKMHLLSQSI